MNNFPHFVKKPFSTFWGKMHVFFNSKWKLCGFVKKQSASTKKALSDLDC